jgi:acyl-CoA thioesterase YciA
MPRDTNPSGDIFGGWTVSQMDLAGATFAAKQAKGRVATVSIEAMEFLRPVSVGDEVSCYCSLVKAGDTSLTVKIETWASPLTGAGKPEKVTEGTFTFVAVDEHGKPRHLDNGQGGNQ